MANDGCSNKATIRRERLAAIVLTALRERLKRPEQVTKFIAHVDRLWAERTRDTSARQSTLDRDRAMVNRELDNLTDAIASGLRNASLQRKLDDLEAQRTALQARRNAETAAAEALTGKHPAALEAARTLIDRIVIHPGDEEGDPPQIDLTANLPALLRAGGAQLLPSANPANGLDTAVKEETGGKAPRLAFLHGHATQPPPFLPRHSMNNPLCAAQH